MLTDERRKQLMTDLGMPNSQSLYSALQQVANEVEQATRAEVRAEVCSAQNSEYAPQDCLSLTDATQVRMEAQEPVGCVLYYEIAPYRGVCGATVGADGGGEFADVFLGDPEACATAAREKVSEMERRGTKLKNASILCNGDIYSYSGSHVTVTSLAPQSPVQCPKCAEYKQEAFEEGRRTDNMRQELKERGSKIDAPQAKLAELEGSYATALSRIANFEAWIAECKAKVAEQSAEIERLQSKLDLLVIERDAQAVLISDQQADVEKQTEISNNFAAQVRQQDEIIASLRAEVERLTKEIDFRQSLLRESNRNCAEHAGVVWTRNVTIDKLKQEARMHAQEARTANATIYEIYQAISGATGEPGNWNGAEPVRTYIKENAALIEKCKCALQCYADQEMRDQWCGPATELLAFIAAQKGGAE